MKFRNGYWLLKPNIRAVYAVEAYDVKQADGELRILAASQPITGRGDTMTPALNVRVFSPAPGVVGVEATHHRGRGVPKPNFELYGEPVAPEIAEGDGTIDFSSGCLTARVHTAPRSWGIEFFCGGRRLTGTGRRAMAHMTDDATGKCYMTDQLDLSVGECIYGLGERFTPFVKNGQVVEMWNGDGGTASELAYKNVPFYVSNRGYGVLVDSPADVAYEVGSENVERVEFSTEAETIRYFVFAGPTPKEAVARYVKLTGMPALPPAWSFGLWLSTSFTTNYDEATTSSFIQGMADRDIPLHVFHFDCFWMKGYQWCDFEWDADTFPNPEAMLKRYHDRGLHVCVWINPYIAQNSKLFDEAMERGYLIRRSDGSVWQTDLWQAGMGIVDFTNPEACRWYQAQLQRLIDMGVDCFKTDFGERIPVRDVCYFDGSDPQRMHNYYTFLYNRTVFGVLERNRGKGEATLFARSGTAGSQQFPVHWGGDNSAHYVSMAETLRAGLSLAASGFAFWSHDISGFELTAPAHVYKRWCQFGMLSSHSRLHGNQSYRVPWLFDDEASEVLARFVKLKCRLMPYLYAKAVEAHEQGVPVMRPMFMEFPDDPAVDYLDRQYMLGDSLLVAPVFSEDGRVRFYLPEGTWTHLLDGHQLRGGRWYEEQYDFFSLPLFLRQNCVLPVGADDHRVAYDYAAGATYLVGHFEEGARSMMTIPDTQGNPVKQICASMDGGLFTANVAVTLLNERTAL
ncbi:MAG: alpha-xylosidase [Clostridia bacterium]|nr:alpha-xylosidase [Clostridia bacterium]